MRKSFLALLMLIVAATGFAQVRGKGRLQGTVTDKASGKPIAGATVTVGMPGGKTAPIVVKTDGKGRWSALGLVSGAWDIDIVAAGYETTRGSVNVSELQMMPAIATQMVPEVRQPEPETVATPASPSVPKEAVDAIRTGEELMKAEKYKEAVVEFEKALPMIPTDTAELQMVRMQLQQVLAQAFYKAGDLAKAIAMLESVTAAANDPFASNAIPLTPLQLLLVNLYLENGNLDKGKALLEKLPAGSVTDPTVYINIGILFLNKKNPADATTYFSKAIALDAKSAEAYYYRGLASVQMKKTRDAKADLEQVLALSPDSAEARDAKQLLAGLK